jgi:hypothetical protein
VHLAPLRSLAGRAHPEGILARTLLQNFLYSSGSGRSNQKTRLDFSCHFSYNSLLGKDEIPFSDIFGRVLSEIFMNLF